MSLALEDAARGHALWRKGSYGGEREFKYYARREVEFLQSLLPEGGAP